MQRAFERARMAALVAWRVDRHHGTLGAGWPYAMAGGGARFGWGLAQGCRPVTGGRRPVATFKRRRLG